MKKVFAIVLSFLLVVSNISLTYATHFCSGEAIESQLMLGAQDLSCGMIMPESTCDQPDYGEFSSNCCDNEYLQLSSDDDFNTVSSIEMPQLDFVVAFIRVYFISNDNFDTTQTEFFNKSPPLVKQNFQVLHQVFII